MGLEGLTGKLRRALKRIKNSIIQECPPELYACEICKKLECNNEEWLKCEKRLHAAEFMKSYGTSAVASTVAEFECPHHTEVQLQSSVSSCSNSSSDGD